MKSRVHLGIDAVGAKHSGAAMVLVDVIVAALENERVGRISLFSSPRASWHFDLPSDPRLQVFEQPLAERGVLGRILWLQLGLPVKVQRLGCDVLLCLASSGIGPSGIPTVTFVHQSLPFCPEALQRCNSVIRLRMAAVRTLMKWSCRRAARIVVQTPTMREWIGRRFGLPLATFAVMPPRAPPLPEAGPLAAGLEVMRRVPPDRRLLYVGNDLPYKNVEMAIRAVEIVERRFPGTTLFVTWPRIPEKGKTLRVEGIGFLDRRALRQAYELATALLAPSLVEAGNLPLLEAMDLGLPILAADRPYARDFCEDAAVYFDPRDPRDLATKVIDLLENPDKCEALRVRGRAVHDERRRARPYDRLIELLVELAAAGPDDRTPACTT